MHLFVLIMTIFTTSICIWNVLDGTKKHLKIAAALQGVNFICSIVLVVNPERVLQLPETLTILYIFASSGALASRMLMDDRVGVVAFALFSIYHYSAGILFAHFRECVFLVGGQVR